MVNGVKCGATANAGSSTRTVRRASRIALNSLLAPDRGWTAKYSANGKCTVKGKYLLTPPKPSACTVSMTQSTKTKVKGKWTVKTSRKSIRLQIT